MLKKILFILFVFLFSPLSFLHASIYSFFTIRLSHTINSPKGIVAGNFGTRTTVNNALFVVNSPNHISQLKYSSNDRFTQFESFSYPSSMSFPGITPSPNSIVKCKFNRDDLADLAVSSETGSPLELFYQTTTDMSGQIHFNNVSAGYTTNYGAKGALACADMNGDGFDDTLILFEGDMTHDPVLAVRLTNPDSPSSPLGTTNLSLARGSQRFAVGDFNEDGHLDVAVTNHTANTVTIYLGNSSGTGFLMSPRSYATGNLPWDVAVGDMNRDGNLDLLIGNQDDVMADRGSVSMLLGNGDGTFQTMSLLLNTHMSNSVSVPSKILLADLTRDNVLDFVLNALTNQSINFREATSELNVFTDTYASNLYYHENSPPLDITFADVNDDGEKDLVFSYPGLNQLYFFIGNTAGRLEGGFREESGTFEVTYTDRDVYGFSAASVTISIDGADPQLMTPVDTNDRIFSDGKLYRYATPLSAGTHRYTITATDGVNPVSLTDQTFSLSQNIDPTAPAAKAGCSLNRNTSPNSMTNFIYSILLLGLVVLFYRVKAES